ncbi:MAG: SAM-dependent chlorinase/fluorinase [Bacteroidetes bacterium]|nr:SAM-dependent chlorinase/fluorinase [Bacteroidota bacterium]
MQLITLTTDFGTQDFYVGALKGALLRQHPALQLIDIAHDIKPFDLVQAAFVVQNCWPEFPNGTIHLLGVHCVYAPTSNFVLARVEGHFFVAPNNGILSLIFGHPNPLELRDLGTGPDAHFGVKTVFVDTVAQLTSGVHFEEIGTPGTDLLQRIRIQPVITKTRIRGTVIHLDYFENAVVNVTRDVFEKVRNGRQFSLFFKRNDPITQLSNSYADVPVGEPLCLFNAAGYLEIAINMGRAASLLGLKVEDIVELVFE